MYRSRDRLFYVSFFNDVGLEVDITPQVISTWNTHWHDDSTKFDNFVERDGELQILHGKMLFGRRTTSILFGGGILKVTEVAIIPI